MWLNGAHPRTRFLGILCFCVCLAELTVAKTEGLFDTTSAMIKKAPVPSDVDLSLYPSCPSTPERTIDDDLEQFVYNLENAHFYTDPFPYMYFCDMFRPHFYAELAQHFPPSKVMQPAVKRDAGKMKSRGQYSAAGSNNNGDKRWKMSVFDIYNLKPNSRWPLLPRAITTWKKLEHILFSKEVEDVLWRKFNLTRTPKFRDFRVQTDMTGYSIGVHPDSPKKILTMMFYVPVDDQTVYDYGTCLHTNKQYQQRDLSKNGVAPCLKKFMFGSNTGYSFVVNDHSYHSVDTVGKHHGVRNTILVNWYDQKTSSASPAARAFKPTR
eukprot:CAMPEP_0198210212 /NCGR_PEP_ID=MMETSP1445-20131203/19960_1 /TAXON_ID=36898 /ORGANISM="Pyramimonas sp., Strain CCMP2087" /LENGTH=322 /DNA_ID=CAMNT_0043884213 /DNA_START=36 /DNA_END=1004 /DNA_ORIENTATION=-